MTLTATAWAARFATVKEAAGAPTGAYGMGAPGVTGVVDWRTLLWLLPLFPSQLAEAGAVIKTDLTLDAMRDDSACA